jgi:hypothetical protein
VWIVLGVQSRAMRRVCLSVEMVGSDIFGCWSAELGDALLCWVRVSGRVWLLCCALRGFALIYVENRGKRSKWISKCSWVRYIDVTWTPNCDITSSMASFQESGANRM